MLRLMKFLKNNSTMQRIFQDAVEKIAKDEPILPAHRIVMNEVLTRSQARLNEIELENERLKRGQLQVVPTIEELQLRRDMDDLKRSLG